MTGRFITFEGGEGTGKSTQSRLLASHFEQSGMKVVQTREPGGPPSAEEIRNLLVTGAPDRWSPMAEALLFFAARVEHWRALIEPALKAGKHVICDRFSDSTMAYQGYAGDLSRETIEKLHALALPGVQPDLTIILDMPVGEGLARAASRKGGDDRFERKGAEFHERLRQAFQDIAKREPRRCMLINANQPIERVHNAVLNAVHAKLGI